MRATLLTAVEVPDPRAQPSGRASAAPSGTELEGAPPAEKIEVLYGEEKSLDILARISRNAEEKLDVCIEAAGPSIIMELGAFKQLVLDAVGRGIRPRYITEITAENIRYCRELARVVELRHLDGVKGNFAVTDREYAGTMSVEVGRPVLQITYSNTRALVRQHQFLFWTLWGTAVSAEQRIREIERGGTAERTEVIRGAAYTTAAIVRFIERAGRDGWCTCGDRNMASVATGVQDIRRAIAGARNRGAPLRYITEVTRENLSHCKELMELVELRHLDHVRLNFSVSKKQYMCRRFLSQRRGPRRSSSSSTRTSLKPCGQKPCLPYKKYAR